MLDDSFLLNSFKIISITRYSLAHEEPSWLLKFPLNVFFPQFWLQTPPLKTALWFIFPRNNPTEASKAVWWSSFHFLICLGLRRKMLPLFHQHYLDSHPQATRWGIQKKITRWKKQYHHSNVLLWSAVSCRRRRALKQLLKMPAWGIWRHFCANGKACLDPHFLQIQKKEKTFGNCVSAHLSREWMTAWPQRVDMETRLEAL